MELEDIASELQYMVVAGKFDNVVESAPLVDLGCVGTSFAFPHVENPESA